MLLLPSITQYERRRVGEEERGGARERKDKKAPECCLATMKAVIFYPAFIHPAVYPLTHACRSPSTSPPPWPNPSPAVRVVNIDEGEVDLSPPPPTEDGGGETRKRENEGVPWTSGTDEAFNHSHSSSVSPTHPFLSHSLSLCLSFPFSLSHDSLL